jgi:hypothetical protein
VKKAVKHKAVKHHKLVATKATRAAIAPVKAKVTG